jgi:hypothetical protein
LTLSISCVSFGLGLGLRLCGDDHSEPPSEGGRDPEMRGEGLARDPRKSAEEGKALLRIIQAKLGVGHVRILADCP